MPSKIEYISPIDNLTYRGKAAKSAQTRDARIRAHKTDSATKPGSMKKKC